MPWTGRARAKRYVARGIAVWTDFGRSIRFLPKTHQAESVKRSIDLNAEYLRACATGTSTERAMANIPIVAPGVLIGRGRHTGANRHVSAGGF